jgi:hypothetical protein
VGDVTVSVTGTLNGAGKLDGFDCVPLLLDAFTVTPDLMVT